VVVGTRRGWDGGPNNDAIARRNQGERQSRKMRSDSPENRCNENAKTVVEIRRIGLQWSADGSGQLGRSGPISRCRSCARRRGRANMKKYRRNDAHGRR